MTTMTEMRNKTEHNEIQRLIDDGVDNAHDFRIAMFAGTGVRRTFREYHDHLKSLRETVVIPKRLMESLAKSAAAEDSARTEQDDWKSAADINKLVPSITAWRITVDLAPRGIVRSRSREGHKKWRDYRLSDVKAFAEMSATEQKEMLRTHPLPTRTPDPVNDEKGAKKQAAKKLELLLTPQPQPKAETMKQPVAKAPVVKRVEPAPVITAPPTPDKFRAQVAWIISGHRADLFDANTALKHIEEAMKVKHGGQ